MTFHPADNPRLNQPQNLTPAAAAPSRGGSAPHRPHPSRHQLRDTVETMLFALILAFTFRTFGVEAFVIPTGSMAPTLNGAHFRVICPSCGYRFNLNANVDVQWVPGRGVVDLRNGELTNPFTVPAPYHIRCPNCGEEIPVRDLPDKPIIYRRESVQSGRGDYSETYAFPYAYNGDRILVMKYLYPLFPPRRWDVIVFREPMRGKENFIKRLVGLPGETVEIVGGEVFINGQVAHKPPDVERAMLQLVYDNDYYPVNAGQVRANGRIWTSPWVPARDGRFAGHWFTGGPVLRFTPTGANPRGRLAFRQEGDYLYNNIGYNATQSGRRLVGHLFVHMLWRPKLAAAALRIVLGPASNRWQVRLAHDGRLTLFQWRSASARWKHIAADRMSIHRSIAPLHGGFPYSLSLSNIDHEARFWFNGQLVLQYSASWTLAQAIALAERERITGQEMPRVFIDPTGPCTLGHLQLWRDIYYTQTLAEQNYPGTGTMGHPLTLKAGQYFVLGDNSNDSDDGRAWNRVERVLRRQLHLPVGVVPQRYLLGKAFLVYWPAGFRPFRQVPWAIIPNVGKIRFIR